MEKKEIIDIQLVKDLMQKLHINSKQLAIKAETAHITIKRLLYGDDQSKMAADLIVRIAHALGIQTHLLVHKNYC